MFVQTQTKTHVLFQRNCTSRFLLIKFPNCFWLMTTANSHAQVGRGILITTIVLSVLIA